MRCKIVRKGLTLSGARWRSGTPLRRKASARLAPPRNVTDVHAMARRKDPRRKLVMMATPLTSARRPEMIPASIAASSAIGKNTATFLHVAMSRLTSCKQRRTLPYSWCTGASSYNKKHREGGSSTFPLPASASSA